MKFSTLLTFICLPALALCFSNLYLNYAISLLNVLVSSLSQQLSSQDISSILSCLGETSVKPIPCPYYETDVWLQRLDYTVENYTVTTEDGYILKVFRVTGSTSSPPGTKKKAIYINHGLGGTSNQWLVQQGNNNLPQILADAGYEVWIGNARGNSYSDKNVNLTVNDLKYWDFSWEEMGLYDLPAVIDKILEISKNQKIYYIGYSMGSTQYLILLSQKPEYNDKISTGILLAPAAVVNHATTPLRASILGLSYNGTYLSDPILGGRINTNNAFREYVGGTTAGEICAVSNLVNCGICANFMFAMFGFDIVQMNYTALPSFYTNYADVIGTKCVVHYVQLMNDPLGRFKRFDYGWRENIQRYNGSSTPPEYDLTKITTPTVIYYGKEDNLVAPIDVEALAGKFQKGTIKELNQIDPTNNASLFNHLDFVVGKDSYSFFGKHILYIFNQALYG